MSIYTYQQLKELNDKITNDIHQSIMQNKHKPLMSVEIGLFSNLVDCIKQIGNLRELGEFDSFIDIILEDVEKKRAYLINKRLVK